MNNKMPQSAGISTFYLVTKKVLLSKIPFLLLIALTLFCLPFNGAGQTRKVNSPTPAAAQKSDQPVSMPYNRILVPAGKVITYGSPQLENHALDAVLIPGAPVLVVEDHTGLAFIQTKQKKVIFRLNLEKDPRYHKYLGTYSGLKVVKIKDSICVFWSIANSGEKASYVVEAYWDGKTARIIRSFAFNREAPAKVALPNEVVIREENGTRYLYVVLNGNNQVKKIRLADGKEMWTAATGAAPFGMVITGNKLFVTNWGGTLPNDTLKPQAGIPWGKIYIDPATGAANNGSVSVIDCQGGHLVSHLRVGLHPNAILLSPDAKWAFVACGNSDNVFVINTLTNQVTDSISVRLSPVKDPYIGDSPDGLAISSDGTTLYVSNGMDNAVAVIKLSYSDRNHPQGVSAKLKGFIPTDAYPAGLQVDDHQLYVCNLEGEGASVKTAKGYNSHHQLATVSIIPLPGRSRLRKDSRQVYSANLIQKAKRSLRAPRKGVAPQPIPERIGEPSVFSHVVYIIKENRTYDQVLGDMKEGNGDSSLCVFGARV
ncbi:MAG TPA: YncE family protein, partial [Chitinophagaceae bacterium]|nr:YncE family protein [Chitinophagaceae bacterium]